jgi:DNA-directed RNA polymerase specialized sigma24 family protein
MNGLTVSEMAQMLGIKRDAAKKRLFYAKIKPVSHEALYSQSALETIRAMSKVGRPKKEG